MKKSNYSVTPVRSSSQKRQFLNVVDQIYNGDANYIRPWDRDIDSVFDPKKNSFFKHGTCERWLLMEGGKVLGRVAAFINNDTAQTYRQPTGGMGFFECPNSQEAANLLFTTCKNWLTERGMMAMDGPINFGERDRYWGCVVKEFDPPVYGMAYNPPYYSKLFETYGFITYFEQYTYIRYVQDPVNPIFKDKLDRIRNRPAFKIEHGRMDNVQKLTEDFRKIYNQAWTYYPNFKPITEEGAAKAVKSLLPVLDPNLLWFAYFNDEPIAFFIMLPDLNQHIKHLKGKSDPISMLRFLWMIKFNKRRIRKMYGLVFGVIPRFWGRGLESAIVEAAREVVQPVDHYDALELNWIGDFNPMMMMVADSVGAHKYKTLLTYRYQFDPKAEPERAPTLVPKRKTETADQ